MVHIKKNLLKKVSDKEVRNDWNKEMSKDENWIAFLTPTIIFVYIIS